MLNSWSLGTIGVCALVAGAVYLWQGRFVVARALAGHDAGQDLPIPLAGGVLLALGALALCNPVTGLGPQHLGMVIGVFGLLMLLSLVRQVAFDFLINRALVDRRDRRVLDRWAALATGAAGLLVTGGLLTGLTECVRLVVRF